MREHLFIDIENIGAHLLSMTSISLGSKASDGLTWRSLFTVTSAAAIRTTDLHTSNVRTATTNICLPSPSSADTSSPHAIRTGCGIRGVAILFPWAIDKISLVSGQFKIHASEFK